MRSTRSLVAVVGASLLLVAGCGGRGSKTSSPSASTSTSDPRDASQLAADEGAADRAVLKLSDLPSGWEGKPNSDDSAKSDEEKAAEDRFAACLQVEATLFGAGARSGAHAKSDDFTDREHHEVSSSVTVVATRERARRQLAAVQKPEFTGCYQTFVNTAIDYAVKHPDRGDPVPAGVSYGTADVVPLSLPGLHAEGIAYRATVPVRAQGQSIDVIFDVALALKGRSGTSATYLSFGEPLPPSFEAQVLNTVIDRLPAS